MHERTAGIVYVCVCLLLVVIDRLIDCVCMRVANALKVVGGKAGDVQLKLNR